MSSRLFTRLLLALAWVGIIATYLHATSVSAQTPNYCTNPQGAAEGGFTLDKDRVCPNEPIKVSGGIPNGLTNIAYIPDYRGGEISAYASSQLLTGIFSYPKPGTYTILQVGSINATGAIKCKTVTVLPLEPIQFSVKSCVGRQVTLTPDVSTLGQYDTYVVNWGDGFQDEVTRAQLEANLQHTYGARAAASQLITLEGVYGTLNVPICRSPSQQSVTLAADVSKPTIQELTSVNANTITLRYQVDGSSPVQLYQNVGGTYTATGQTANGSGTFTVSANTRQSQCFKVVSQDVCGSTRLESSEVCSLVLDAKAENKKNTLSWQPYAANLGQGLFQGYTVRRNDTSISASLTNPASTTYTDTDVTCGTQYCYRILAITVEGSVQTQILSAPICVTGVSGSVPDNLGTVVVSVSDNHPTVDVNLPTTNLPTNYTLVVSRSDGSGTYQPVSTLVDKHTFTDETVNASTASYCYQVQFQGGCGMTLPASKPACTILLTSSNKASIDWTASSPFWPESVGSYAVELIDSTKNSATQQNVGNTTHYQRSTTEVVYTYRVVATSGSYTSYSNYYTFPREDRFSVPDAFTPNGDHINDVFLPKGLNADVFIMNIYSRWGEVVYSTTDRTMGWDGTIRGQPAHQGQYLYRIEVEDIAGQKTIRTGRLLLLR